MIEESGSDTKSETPKAEAAAPAAKAKIGDVVMFWAEPQGLFRHAVVCSIDDGNIASLKVTMPPKRKGGGGGIAKVEGVPFALRPKEKPEKPATGWCLEQ